MKADDLIAVPWRTGLRWYDGVRWSEYGWGVPLPGGGEVIASFRPRPGMTEEDSRAIQRFHEAATDMAHALVGLLETTRHGILTEDKCNAARAALTRAGVTLP